MAPYYFNAGCALNIYKPETQHRILQFLNTRFGQVTLHSVCCHHEPGIEPGSVIINVCAGCDRRFRSLYAGISTISLWEILDGMEGFPYPDYHGLTVSVHDPCPIRIKPAVHQAVRSLLRKMHIEIIEAPASREHSVCCGDSFYPALPVEKIYTKMRQRAEPMPCEEVCVYCVSCVKSMHVGGKTPRYLVDLLFNEPTEIQTHDVVAWHAELQEYIDQH